MKENYLVSVVMPTYNRATKIDRSIISVIKQTHQNWELIIIDDFSRDDTHYKIEKYSNDKRIRYFKLEENIGASGARNIGIKESKGEFITFLDSDDEYFPTKIERQLELLLHPEKNSLGLVSCGAIDYRDGKEYNRRMPIKRENYYQSMLSKRKRIGAGTPFLMVRSNILKSRNIYFDESLKAMEDWDFVLRIIKITKYDFVREYLVKVNHHGDERLYTSKNAVEAIKIQYIKYKDWLSELPDAHKKFIKNGAAIIAHHHSVDTAINFVNDKNKDLTHNVDRLEMYFFSKFIFLFHWSPIKMFYLKYLK